MRRYPLALVLLCAIPALAQTTTTYVGTIKDLTGATVTSGRITWALNAPSGGNIPGTGSFVSNTVSCLINASGTPVSSVDGTSPCTVINNTALTPTGTSYTMCRQPYNVTPGSCTITYALGGTVDVSTIVPTPATQPYYGVASLTAANTWGALQTFSGGLVATTGTFSGPLNGTSASFSGALTVGGTITGNVTGIVTGTDIRSSAYPVIDLRAKGLVADGLQLKTCSITSGAAVLTCTGSPFTSADVGKAVGLFGAGAAGASLMSTITGYTSAAQVTIGASASTTIGPSGVVWYGTDNTAAWCAAVSCTTATTPNVYGTRQPGRTFILPYGTYIVTGTVYLHNNDNLVNPNGQATSELVLLNNTDNIDLLCMSGNSSAGTNSCTVDSNGTQQNAIEGIMFQSPFASQNCIDAGSNTAGGVSGFDIHNNWFECAVGIFVHGNTGHIWGNTFDSATVNGIMAKGDGTSYGNNPTHSILIDDNQFFAQGSNALQLDGVSSVQFKHNIVNYAKQFSVLINSPGSQTSYRVEIENNTFVTSQSSSFYTSTQNHIYVGTPLVDSSIRNNKFRLSRQYDINLLSAGIVNLAIEDNEFTDENGTAVNVSNAGANLTIKKNKFSNIGNYAVDSQIAAILQGNECHAPFQVTGQPAQPYDQGCFRFQGSGSTGVIAQNNSTDSTTDYSVVIHGNPTLSITSGNSSANSTYDVYIFQAGSVNYTWGERITNTGCIGTACLQTPFTNLVLAGGGQITNNQGTGELLQHSTGAITSGHCAQFDATGNVVDAGATCGTGSPGVASINTVTGAFTFTGAGVSCTSTTCTFSGTGSGVTSVAMTAPSWLTVGGSPITTSGTLAVTATGGQITHRVIGTCGSATSFAPCALVAGDIPTIAESQVTNLTTDLAAKVGNTTTVNGHALSSNVTVSATDISTGTLPNAQLPSAVSVTSVKATEFITNAEFSNGTCTTAKTIDPVNGNKQTVTLTNGSTCALTFTQPASGTATVQLKITQSAVSTFNGGISGCKWPGGVVPTITQTTGAVDMLSVYLDGTTAYCQIAQAFS